MDIRDEFAKAALMVLLSDPGRPTEDCVSMAWYVAGAMLAERRESREPKISTIRQIVKGALFHLEEGRTNGVRTCLRNALTLLEEKGEVMDEDTTQAAWEYAEELKQREDEENGYE